MKFILGQKKAMTQIFTEDGTVIPVTVVSAGPCSVVRIKKSESSDGYNAVVLGLVGKKKLSKRELGQARNLGNLQYIKEFRTDELGELKSGDSLSVSTFEVGDKVKVIGTSKGKGFQGVVKRHGFHGQKATHGTKDQERVPGSIGATEPARVFPGMRMPGHMGNARVTIKNLEIVQIHPETNELFIKGAVPGSRGGLLLITADGELKVNQASSASSVEDNTEAKESPDKNKEIKKEEQNIKEEKTVEKKA